MVHVTECPLCQIKVLENFLSTADHTVSHETFQLIKCTGCGFVMTSPRPDDEHLGNYYLSEAYISHSNNSKSLLDLVYRLSRRFTLSWKYNLVRAYSEPETSKINLLDFGCGTGDFLKECKRKGLQISGVEPSEIARTQAVANTGATIASHIEAINNKFTSITLWHVLEHVSALNETLHQLKAALAENGTMFIAVPNLHSLEAKNYHANWAAYDVPRHLWHFTKNTMELLLARHKLKLTTILPMKLDAYYVSLLSEKYKRGNTNVSGIVKAIAQGWQSNRHARTTNEFSSLIYIARK